MYFGSQGGERDLSSQGMGPGSQPQYQPKRVDPYRLVEDDLKTVHAGITQVTKL